VADVLVVGGGSAGCVLAARLSEDAGCEVLLLEGGPDAAVIGELPPDVVDASEPTEAHDWGYVAEPDALGRSVSLPRARIIGGCSSTNGCFALRGAPADYDGWAQAGNVGWGFGDVLPFFRRLETDADFAGDWHGASGPLPIRRHPPAELNAVQLAFIDAARASGLSYAGDHNRPGALGVGPTPRNAHGGVRMSTALTYLAAARGRRNLAVRGEAVADRVVVRQGRATGVRLAGGEMISADRVVLAAGAYASPASLQRSGIGPAALLAGLGIDVVADLPGVGKPHRPPPVRGRSADEAGRKRRPVPGDRDLALPGRTAGRGTRSSHIRRRALRRADRAQPDRPDLRARRRAGSSPIPRPAVAAVRRGGRPAPHRRGAPPRRRRHDADGRSHAHRPPDQPRRATG